MSAPLPTPHPSAWAARGARVSWIPPFLLLLLVGVAEKAELPAELMRWPRLFAVGGVVAGGLGLALGAVALSAASGDRVVRRQALTGAGASVVVLVVAVAAWGLGVSSGTRAEADLRRLTDAALRDSPGWNGGALIDGANVFAFEVDPSSELAKALARGSGRPYHVLLVGIDDRAGEADVTVALEGARAHHGGGAVTTTVAPSPVVRVAAGERLDGVAALFAPGDSFRDVDTIEIRVNGVAWRLPGRYFTLEEKRAIDASRERSSR